MDDSGRRPGGRGEDERRPRAAITGGERLVFRFLAVSLPEGGWTVVDSDEEEGRIRAEYRLGLIAPHHAGYDPTIRLHIGLRGETEGRLEGLGCEQGVGLVAVADMHTGAVLPPAEAAVLLMDRRGKERL